jgi:hypothetical protein
MAHTWVVGVLIAVLKAIVILLAVVVRGALLSTLLNGACS